MYKHTITDKHDLLDDLVTLAEKLEFDDGYYTWMFKRDAWNLIKELLDKETKVEPKASSEKPKYVPDPWPTRYVPEDPYNSPWNSFEYPRIVYGVL